MDHKQDEASNITTFFFKAEKPVRYTAGQFIELTAAHDNPDMRGIKHWFTLSSSPTQDLLSITTKFAGDKSSSFKRTLFGLPMGTELLMSDVMGDFVLPKLVQTPLIFVAGGIGITPFHSILTWLASTGEERPIKLLYAVGSEEEIIFQPTFDAANVNPTIIVGQPSASWGGERGRITADFILGTQKPTEDTLIYISGPEPMVETLENDLKKQGIKGKQLVLDFFPNYTTV